MLKVGIGHKVFIVDSFNKTITPSDTNTWSYLNYWIGRLSAFPKTPYISVSNNRAAAAYTAYTITRAMLCKAHYNVKIIHWSLYTGHKQPSPANQYKN